MARSIKDDENDFKFGKLEAAILKYAHDRTIPIERRTYNLECVADYIKYDLLLEIEDEDEE